MGKGKVYYKTEDEIGLLRESSLLVGKTLAEVAKMVKPGVTTLELDAVAEEFIRDNDAVPGFKGYGGFPNSLCTSVNAEVVHGIPNNRPLEEGDIVSVDCGVLKNGFYGDSAYTFAVGNISAEVEELLKVTKESLNLAIEQAIAGLRIGDIGYAVQNHAERHGYGVVRELVGHGLGRSLHESPEVPNYGRRGNGLKLREGLVLAIEPMINLGVKEVRQAEDGWTIVTADGLPSAHFEHDVVIRKGKAEVLSTFKWIEEVLKEK
ncbi:MAG: type I methionyl aminopeptidase [Flavobacteriales bacterium]|nr:type I methionyl aminopeptidase [Flavobacteriales bacterium]MDG1767623.1 type I methionyl aminopeptidase [Flavobacteriales bacterium]